MSAATLVPQERAMSDGKPSIVAVFAIVASLTSGRADGQSKSWEVVGTGRSDGLGRSVTFTPDVDGDGVPDLLVGAPNDYAYATLGTPGRVLLYSGATLGLLRTFDGDAAKDSFGATVASLGDVDGDGVPDFAIAAPHREVPGQPRGAVFVFSGAGPLIRSFTSVASDGTAGEAMTSIGDVDGDGVKELVYSDLNGGGRTIFVVSGATGTTIQSVRNSALDFGFAVGRTGDADADGVEDFAVCDHGSGGHVRVFSGATGTKLFVYANDEEIVKPAGDVDGDGHADLILTKFGSGKVPVVSGATGLALYTFTGNSFLGHDVSSTGDFDGDGVSDLVVVLGKTNANPKDLFLYSGANGVNLGRYDLGGITRIDATADLDGDGVSDFLGGNDQFAVGQPDAGPQGSISVASGATGAVSKIVGVSFLSDLASSLTLVNDRDGDGFRDVAITVDGGLDEKSGPVVEIVSGFDGHELSRIAQAASPTIGVHPVVFTGDADGDGIDDLALSRDKNGVEVRSGRDDSLIATILPAGVAWVGQLAAASDVNGTPLLAMTVGPPYGFVVVDLTTGSVVTSMLGTYYPDIACVGDVDGDGFVDWAVHDWYAHALDLVTGGPTPTILWTFTGSSNADVAVFTSTGDLDNDGTDDLLFASSPNRCVTARSGKTGNVIGQAFGPPASPLFGFTVTSLGDVNRDGICDFAAGEPYDYVKNTSHGAVHVFSGATFQLLTRIDGERDGQFLGWVFARRRWHDDGRIDPDPIPDLVCGSDYAEAGRGRAEAIRLPSLFLQIDPPAAPSGQRVAIDTRGGPAGAPAGLLAVAFDATPVGLFVAFGTLDPSGNWSIAPTIPSGLAGHTVTLRSYAIGFSGKVVPSSDETLTFE